MIGLHRAHLVAVLRKEITDLLRDRKSMFWTLFASIISGPLVLGLLYTIAKTVGERIERTTAYVVNAEAAPDLMRYLERRGIRIETAKPDFEARIAAGELDAVLVIDQHYAQDLTQARPARVTLVTDSSRDRSAPIVRRLEAEVRAYGQQLGRERLVLFGVSPAVAHPIVLEALDLATPVQRSARIFQIMAFYALFAGLMGAIAAALDVTAGERERQTLEPLLATPVTPLALAVGKWLATSAINLLAITASLGGFLLALQVVPLARIGLPFEFGLGQFAAFMAVLIPFGLMVPAVLLFFGAQGKTAKEAQSSLSIGLSLVGMLPLISFLRQTQAPWWDAWIPVNGQFAVLTKILRAETVPPLDMVAVGVMPLVIALLAVWAFSRKLADERLLAGR
ncbi:MAG: ABC transporter permease [Casimicrobiaceae bacterium]|nr:ABC transporter permease [Casimicrobiaceae bacterium]